MTMARTARVLIVQPLPCAPEPTRDWDWWGLASAAVEPLWEIQGAELKVTLPPGLPDGQHLLCVLSGPRADSPTWHEGGVPFTRIQFVSTGMAPVFVRGDSNQDGGMNIADAVYILQNLFTNGPPILCPDAADSNDDENVDLADPVYLLQNLFANGPAIPAPSVGCGVDETGAPAGGPDLAPCDYPVDTCRDAAARGV